MILFAPFQGEEKSPNPFLTEFFASFLLIKQPKQNKVEAGVISLFLALRKHLEHLVRLWELQHKQASQDNRAAVQEHRHALSTTNDKNNRSYYRIVLQGGQSRLFISSKKRKEKKEAPVGSLLHVATCSVNPATLTYRKGKLMNHSGKVQEQLLILLLAYFLSGKCRNYCWEELQQLTSQRGCPPKPGVSAGFTRFPLWKLASLTDSRQGANF